MQPTLACMAQQVQVPDSVHKQAKQLRDEKEFSSIGDAIRYVFIQEGYDV